MNAVMHLPGYRILEPLYSGTRTLVYRGIRNRDRVPVVIKVPRHPFPSFHELVQFRNQYAIAKHLDQPNLVKPLALEPYQHSYALIMEDFGGISLADWLQRDRPWEHLPQRLPQLLQIMLQVVVAVDALHRQRVIHKDLKPANILITPDAQQVKLTDFSIASLLPRETQEIRTANALEGTLAYLAPEQTGRMNRGIDYRSDFYALGITLYQLLTGQVPFVSDDPMELIHCHLAQDPVPAHHRNPDVPPVLAEITNKLMAKNAEDRYQSAFGLKHDLACCLAQWQTQAQIEPFELGQRDLSDRFLIPEKLYGRAVEVQTLLAAFDRVSQGSSELMLVAGFSGVGKTVVVNEVHKPIVKQRGYFIKGKFDQLNRTIPFSALVHALRDLMEQLLQESDAELQAWTAKILAAVGESGQVIIDVIPELAQIIGPQPAAIALSGTAAQNRFNVLFQKFIQVFTSAEHPLVIFLDDLQWADSASLNLMQLLMTELGAGYLLLIGAYRDNEVSLTHPLMLTIAAIARAGATVNTITLHPLPSIDLNHLVADTLHCTAAMAQPLTDLVIQKTQGNPFFATQFLKALHQDDLIQFDRQVGYWQCHIAQVRNAALTDDVVEFMALQVQKLPIPTQDILKLAACIGSHFDLTTLAIVSEQSEIEAATALWPALQQALILPQSQIYKFFQENADDHEARSREVVTPEAESCVYRFLHDRVQQAAYFLIPETRKQATHLKIGQLLQHSTPVAVRDSTIFSIVNQLNAGADLLTDPLHRTELAQLNLQAGRKALAATAYVTAAGYCNKGRSLLESHSWHTHYALTLALYETAAEAAYLNGNVAEMEQLATVLDQQTVALLDRVKTCQVRIQAYSAQNKLKAAVDTGLTFLDQLQVSFPTTITPAHIQTSFQEIAHHLNSNAIAELIDLPEMQDPEKLAAMQILSAIFIPIYIVAPNLLPLVVCKQILLSLQYGNAPESAVAYANYGLISCGILGDIESGYQFGQLGLAVLAKLNVNRLKAKILNVVYSCTAHWKQSLRASLSAFEESYISGLETGDLEFAGYAAFIYCYSSYLAGTPLAEVAAAMDQYTQALEKIRQATSLNYLAIFWQAVLKLQTQSDRPSFLIGDVYNEAQKLLQHQQANDTSAIGYLYFNKLILCYLFEEFQQAATCAAEFEKYLEGQAGVVMVPTFYFYDSLTQLALYQTDSLAISDQANCLQRVETNQAKMHHWAHHAPMNYLHKWELVEAEQQHILGNKLAAMEHYDRAIAIAKEHGYIQDEALANELAAKFYRAWGKDKIAATYLQDAYYGYARWGAKAKTADLERRYPHLLAPILQAPSYSAGLGSTLSISPLLSSSTSNSSHSSSAIDFAAILKASQILSSEIQLERLVAKLLQVTMESSGAQKAALLIPAANQLTLEAIASLTNAGMTLLPKPLSTPDNVPLTLVNYVKHSLKPVVLDHVTAQTDFAADAYFAQHQPKSVLCTPILNQGKLIAVLYLENSLTIAAFTRDRLEIIHLLCTQAAISLENARLYRTLQTSETRLRIIIETEPECVKILAADGTILDMNPAGLAMLEADAPDQIIGQKAANCILPEYRRAFAEFGRRVFHGETAQLEFVTVGLKGTQRWVDSHAAPLRNEHNEIIGLLAITRDISDRKAAELALQQLNAELEHRIAQRTAALQASEAKFRGFFDFAPIGIAVADVQTYRFAVVNRAFCQLLGYSETELLAQASCLNISVADDWESERPHAEALFRGEVNAYHIEKRYIKKNGEIIIGSLTTTALRDETGQITHLIGMVQDITQRKRAEEQLRQSDAHLRLAQRIAKLGSWEFTVHTAQIIWSEEIFRIFGRDIASGTPTFEELQHYFHPDDRDRHGEIVQAAIAIAQPYDEEFRIYRPDHSLAYIQVKGEVVLDQTGQTAQLTGTVLDITDRKLAEQKIQQTAIQLAATNQELESFSYSVSHDLRAPLRHVHGFVNALRQRLQSQEALSDPKVVHYLQVIENSSQKMAQLIDGLLMLSRIGRKSMEYHPVDLGHLVDEAIALVHSPADSSSSVRFVVGALPTVSGDATLLQQVFTNLIGNAVKFSRNTAAPCVEIGTGPDGIIFVRDNGVGFQMDYADKLFGAFQRLHSQTDFEGTGIGLAIVQRIIHRHGGRIWAESQPNQGATFYLTLVPSQED